MTQPPSHPQSLSAARERAVKLLGDAFAADAFEMDELETRLASVYRAASIAEVDALTRDLVPATADRSPVPALSQDLAVAPARIGAFMSTSRRGGRWMVPSRLEARAVMSDLTIDLREAVMPPGGCELVLRVVMASVVVIVRPGTNVTVDIDAVLASVEDDARLASKTDPSLPPVRMTGSAFLGSVELRAMPMPHEMLVKSLDPDDLNA